MTTSPNGLRVVTKLKLYELAPRPIISSMSSTITTTTVATVTAAATFDNLGQVLTMVAIGMLAVALLAREISTVARSETGRRVGRGLDIALMPLVVTFVVVLALNNRG